MTSIIEQTFNALDWHDAILLQLTVDRSSPGENDEVCFRDSDRKLVRQRPVHFPKVAMLELYTKLFVRTKHSHQELLSLVAKACGGVTGADWTVVSGDYELDVRRNENSTEAAQQDHPRDFIYFPYTIEVITEGDPDAPSAYLGFVGSLMHELHAEGMQVVAACDWEEDLPGGGQLGM